MATRTQFISIATLFPPISMADSDTMLMPSFIEEHAPTLTSMQAVGYEFNGAARNDGYLTLPVIAVVPVERPLPDVEPLSGEWWLQRPNTNYVRYNRMDLY